MYPLTGRESTKGRISRSGSAQIMEGCRPRHPLCHSKGAGGDAPPFIYRLCSLRQTFDLPSSQSAIALVLSSHSPFLRADLGQANERTGERESNLKPEEGKGRITAGL